MDDNNSDNIHDKIRSYLIFSLDENFSQISETARRYIKEYKYHVGEQEKFEENLSLKFSDIADIKSIFNQSNIIDAIKKFKQLKLEYQLLLAARDINLLNQNTPVNLILPCVININKNFPKNLSLDLKIYDVLRDKLKNLQSQLIKQFHILLSSHFNRATEFNLSSEIWVVFFKDAKHFLQAYISVSLLYNVILFNSSSVLDKFKDCIDNALTPLWGRFHFHLLKGREENSQEQYLWTFTYAETFFNMITNLCVNSISWNELNSLYPLEYEIATKSYIVDKICKFLKLHSFNVFNNNLENKSSNIHLIEAILDLENEMAKSSYLNYPISSVIVNIPKVYLLWTETDFYHVKMLIEKSCKPGIIYSPKFSVGTFQCYESVYECINNFHVIYYRYQHQSHLSQLYISDLILEPLLSLILSLLLLQIRACSVIRGLSNNRLPHWVGKCAGFEAYPLEIKNLLSTMSYIEISFDGLVKFNCNLSRFQNHWKLMKSWIAATEWSENSAHNMIDVCMKSKQIPNDINADIVATDTDFKLDSNNSISNLLENFKLQVKALKNAIEVQVFESIENE